MSRRTSAEDTRKPIRRVEQGEGNGHQYVRGSGEPKEHTQQQVRNDEMKPKLTAGKKKKKTCEKPKAEREEHMKHTEDLHIQHKVNDK